MTEFQPTTTTYRQGARTLPGGYYRSAAIWDLTNRQDWELSELAQEGIASRGYLPGPYSNREELLHALDAFVLARTRNG